MQCNSEIVPVANSKNKQKMKQTSKKQESNFLFFNPNPTAKFKKSGEAYRWTKPDCCIRAFCGATKLPWQDAYDVLCAVGRKNYDVPNSLSSLGEALEDAGFHKVSIRIKKGDSRPTVKALADAKKDKTCVFSLAGHVVAADGGCYYDCWDCGDKSVYTYWEK